MSYKRSSYRYDDELEEGEIDTKKRKLRESPIKSIIIHRNLDTHKLRQKDEYIDELKHRIHNIQFELDSLTDKYRSLVDHSRKISDKDQYKINELERAIFIKDSEINDMNKQFEKDRSRFRSEISEFKKQNIISNTIQHRISSLEHELAQKTEEIETLRKQQLIDNDNPKVETVNIENSSNQMIELQKQLEEKTIRILELERDKDQSEGIINNLKNETTEQLARINSLSDDINEKDRILSCTVTVLQRLIGKINENNNEQTEK